MTTIMACLKDDCPATNSVRSRSRAGSRSQDCDCYPEMTARQLALLLGTINAALPFSLLAAAQLEIEASLAAVLNAMAPLCGALVAAVWLGQRVTAAAKAGLVLGVVGVTLVVGLSPFTIDFEFVLAVLACLAAAFAYGIGANLVRVRFAGEPPLSIAIGQQLAAAIVLLPLLPVMPVRS